MERPSNCWTAELCDGIRIGSIAAVVMLLGACGSGSSSSGASDKATACLNADLYDVGTHVVQSALSATEALYTDSTVQQNTSFNNVSSLTETEALEETGFPQIPELIFQTETHQRYTRLDGKTLLKFGDVTTAPLGNDLVLADYLAAIGLPADQLAPVVTTVTHNPPLELRFDLSPGQSYTQSYTSSTNTSITIEPATIPLIVFDTATSSTTTYVGRESVTVPAGTFEACKFIDAVTTPGGTATTTTWLAVGSGLTLKSEDGSGKLTELVSASINGIPVQ